MLASPINFEYGGEHTVKARLVERLGKSRRSGDHHPFLSSRSLTSGASPWPNGPDPGSSKALSLSCSRLGQSSENVRRDTLLEEDFPPNTSHHTTPFSLNEILRRT